MMSAFDNSPKETSIQTNITKKKTVILGYSNNY